MSISEDITAILKKYNTMNQIQQLLKYDDQENHSNVSHREQFSRDRVSSDLGKMVSPGVVVIIGLGGVGGHIAEMVASLKNTDVLIMFDDDIVELSNLNRSAFYYHHIGGYKVDCAADIVSQRNERILTVPIRHRVRNENINDLHEILKKSEDYNNVISRIITASRDYRIESYIMKICVYDCRDNYLGDYDAIKTHLAEATTCDPSRIQFIRTGYNGRSISLDTMPQDHPCWGTPGYATVPSSSMPSRIIAQLAVLSSLALVHDKKEIIFANQINQYAPFTFDLLDLIPAMAIASSVRKLKDTDEKKYKRFIKSLGNLYKKWFEVN